MTGLSLARLNSPGEIQTSRRRARFRSGEPRAPISLVRGNIDLVILQLINRDLVAKGVANLQVSIRGNLQNPNVNGRLQLSKASLSYSDLPYVVDNADGSISFDRNRATIERLTAETGGGTITFTGSLDFGAALDSGTALVYRLQAEARRVRVRLPQDISTTFDASLRLTGASDASTLSGTVTLNRASFNPRSDLGQLLAQASAPTPVSTEPNQYLQGMRFDVRIESASNFQVETSLTRDVEAEVDLRLRGSPLQPVLQGTVSISQGELQVLGTKYTIDRGDIRFLNPVKIEPTVDMDLETKLRGVTVNVTLAGSPSNLKMNWSSDPPLQQSEIIALLATGRDPTLAGNEVAPGVTSGGSNNFAAAGTGLVGQALNAQLSSRLQRFFGATRVKIDPTLIGRREPSASAPDMGTASIEGCHSYVHHQPEPHAGTTDTGSMGSEQDLVGDRRAGSEWRVWNRLSVPEEIQVSRYL